MKTVKQLIDTLHDNRYMFFRLENSYQSLPNMNLTPEDLNAEVLRVDKYFFANVETSLYRVWGTSIKIEIKEEISATTRDDNLTLTMSGAAI